MTDTGTLYSRIRDLPVVIDEVALDRLELPVSPEFTRVTTLVVLRGLGHEGIGEDVTYEADEAALFAITGPPDLRGEWTIHTLSQALDALDLFPAPPSWEPSRNYRRWAFESAALDLGLRQAGQPLWRVLGEDCHPTSFVISTGLGDPPSPERVLQWAEMAPGIGFKLDATPSWTRELMEQLGDAVDVDVIDLKGHYTGTTVDSGADPVLYATVAEEFPDAWLEDPRVDDRTRIALAGAEDRVTWDAPIHSVDDIAEMPIAPRTINIKPSRIGSLERLMAVYDYVREADMGAYGGGQYELGPGRGHIQYLASMFHPDAPNDTSPVDFHKPPHAGAPSSPLRAAPAATGFRWES
jgi:L-alanine-DL-glutamate epimerase-like enolase superfamily enzyme